MTRRVVVWGALVSIGLGALGCNAPLHAVITVEDPGGIAAGFDAVWAGEEREALRDARVAETVFPITLLVTAPARGEAELWVEARRAGEVLGRGRTSFKPRRERPRPATVMLRPPCLSVADCPALDYCSGTKGCVEGSCGCVASVCGDGLLDPASEGCDDGNREDGDACTNACTPARCGDGVVWVGRELCDDGNTLNSDGCTNFCTTPSCGDGVTQPPEECDDENDVNTDVCTSVCLIARCGDGFVQGGELCDDGDADQDNGCTSLCRPPFCGDGFPQANEQCDDGDLDNTNACTTLCRTAGCGDGYVYAGVEPCDDGNSSNTDACTNLCAVATCGDGFVYAGFEQCDDANREQGDRCTNACTAARCGDGHVFVGRELCDDGNELDGDECTNNCTVGTCGNGTKESTEQCDPNDSDLTWCSSRCLLAFCGNEIVEGVEVCDDGNAAVTDSCIECKTARCGDGHLWAGIEACDDGNVVDNDECRNDCTVPGCGDGARQDPEECDDGNADPFDLCTTRCTARDCEDDFKSEGELCAAPWLVELVGTGVSCAGALLTELSVLTTADCALAPLEAARVGFWNGLESQTIAVVNATLHEDHSGLYANLALVELGDPVTFGELVYPIELPAHGASLEPGSAAELLSPFPPGAAPSIGLTLLPREIMTDDEVVAIYGNTLGEIPAESHGLFAKDSSSCLQGGLVIDQWSDAPVLHGLVLHADPEGDCATYPDIAVDVAPFVEWILTKVN